MEGQNLCTRPKSKLMEVFWVFTQPRPISDGGRAKKNPPKWAKNKSELERLYRKHRLRIFLLTTK